MHQERAAELQAFVEALLACSDEPADVSELQRSEAAAAARAERLQSRLDGPERAAELAAAQQQQASAALLSFRAVLGRVW